MDEQLLPCPFCGYKEPIVSKTYNEITHGRLEWDGGYIAHCPQCNIGTKAGPDPEYQKKLWNTRVEGI